MHLTTDIIADYAEVLNDAQRKATQARNLASNEYIGMVTPEAMMGSQRSPQTDINWEDVDARDKDL